MILGCACKTWRGNECGELRLTVVSLPACLYFPGPAHPSLRQTRALPQDGGFSLHTRGHHVAGTGTGFTLRAGCVWVSQTTGSRDAGRRGGRDSGDPTTSKGPRERRSVGGRVGAVRGGALPEQPGSPVDGVVPGSGERCQEGYSGRGMRGVCTGNHHDQAGP